MAVLHEDLKGAFSSPGATADRLYCRKGLVSLNFASTGTVQLRRRMDGTNWRVVVTKTATEEFEFEAAAPCEWDLNCTSAGGNIDYLVRPELVEMIAQR